MKFDRKKRKKRIWWSKQFAWFPKKALHRVDNDDKPVWVWLESYLRFWNYGAIVNYVGFELPDY